MYKMQHVTTGWHSLSDDPLRHILTYVPVHDCRRGPGVVSRALLATATSPALARTRFCEPYTLRGEKHGVVHALATAMGTRPWPKESVTSHRSSATAIGTVSALVPPLALSISIHRVQRHPPEWTAAPDADDDACLKHGLVDSVLDEDRDDVLSTAAECGPSPGSFVTYTLPFKLALSHFRFAFGCCNASAFRFWVFEAFDSEQDGWRVLYDSAGVSPWAVLGLNGYKVGGFGDAKVIPVDAAFASSRFRIRQKLTPWVKAMVTISACTSAASGFLRHDPAALADRLVSSSSTRTSQLSRSRLGDSSARGTARGRSTGRRRGGRGGAAAPGAAR